MKLGYSLVIIGLLAVFGGLIDTIAGFIFVGVSFFAEPILVGISIGTLLLGLVLVGLGVKRLAKQGIKNAAEAEKAPAKKRAA